MDHTMKKTKAPHIIIFFLLAVVAIFLVQKVTHILDNPWAIFLLIILSIPSYFALKNGAPFVPTPFPVVEKILKIANIKPNEKVYDLGCGDGRIIYLAAKKYQADATGFELSPIIFALAKLRQLFWLSKAKIRFANSKQQNLKNADVIIFYMTPQYIKQFLPKFNQELKKGTRVISYEFPIHDFGTKTEIHKTIDSKPIYLYIK